MTPSAERFAAKKWGVFNHYLYHDICNTSRVCNKGTGITNWNDAVALFDVERLAYSLHKMNVGYYFITLMQGTKYMLAPNETYDKIAGTVSGEACSTRDLPAELIKALDKYGIDLCLYFTGDGPHVDEVIGNKFGYRNPTGHEAVTKEFCEKWASVLEEYALRYSGGVKAWWLDGFFERLGYTDELRGIFHKAIKKHAPDAAVGFNNEVKPGFFKVYSEEEFLAGEFNDLLVVPFAKYVDGALSHILAPLGYPKNCEVGKGWGQVGLRHTKEYVRDFIRATNEVGGIVTLDIATHIDGSLDPEQEAALRWVGENL